MFSIRLEKEVYKQCLVDSYGENLHYENYCKKQIFYVDSFPYHDLKLVPAQALVNENYESDFSIYYLPEVDRDVLVWHVSIMQLTDKGYWFNMPPIDLYDFISQPMKVIGKNEMFPYSVDGIRRIQIPLTLDYFHYFRAMEDGLNKYIAYVVSYMYSIPGSMEIFKGTRRVEQIDEMSVLTLFDDYVLDFSAYLRVQYELLKIITFYKDKSDEQKNDLKKVSDVSSLYVEEITKCITAFPYVIHHGKIYTDIPICLDCCFRNPFKEELVINSFSSFDKIIYEYKSDRFLIRSPNKSMLRRLYSSYLGRRVCKSSKHIRDDGSYVQRQVLDYMVPYLKEKKVSKDDLKYHSFEFQNSLVDSLLEYLVFIGFPLLSAKMFLKGYVLYESDFVRARIVLPTCLPGVERFGRGWRLPIQSGLFVKLVTKLLLSGMLDMTINVDTGLSMYRVNLIVQFVPDHLLCPLSKKLYKDPYFTPDGNIYSFKWLCRYLKKYNSDPISGSYLEIEVCAPCIELNEELLIYSSGIKN